VWLRGVPKVFLNRIDVRLTGTELSRVRTELRLLPPEAYVERSRHCYAIKCRGLAPEREDWPARRTTGARRGARCFFRTGDASYGVQFETDRRFYVAYNQASGRV
jgi:hypothetical protein